MSKRAKNKIIKQQINKHLARKVAEIVSDEFFQSKIQAVYLETSKAQTSRHLLNAGLHKNALMPVSRDRDIGDLKHIVPNVQCGELNTVLKNSRLLKYPLACCWFDYYGTINKENKILDTEYVLDNYVAEGTLLAWTFSLRNKTLPKKIRKQGKSIKYTIEIIQRALWVRGWMTNIRYVSYPTTMCYMEIILEKNRDSLPIEIIYDSYTADDDVSSMTDVDIDSSNTVDVDMDADVIVID